MGRGQQAAIHPFAAVAILGIPAAEQCQVEEDASVLVAPAATAGYPCQAVGSVSAAFVQVAVADCSQPSRASTVGCSAGTWSREVAEAAASRPAEEAC